MGWIDGADELFVSRQCELAEVNGEITGVVIERLRGRDFSEFHKEVASML